MKLKINTFFLLLFFLSLSSCAHNPDRFYFGHYSEAEALFQKGLYGKAIQKYQAYIDENPEGHLAVISRYYIARSRAALGQKDEAREIYQDIIKNYPEVVWANFSETQLKELDVALKEEAKEMPQTSVPVQKVS